MTLIRKVKGFVMKGDRLNLKREPILVHFTSDNKGETLSMGAHGMQFTVRYEDIERIVDRERAKGYKDGHDIVDETGRGFEA